jgi:hypothetical protein
MTGLEPATSGEQGRRLAPNLESLNEAEKEFTTLGRPRLFPDFTFFFNVLQRIL